MFINILIFILILLPWFIQYSFNINYNYYNNILLPWFAPKPIFYTISWSIIYVLISLSIFLIIKEYKIKEIPKSYKLSLLINFLFNNSFIISFFLLKNNFISFISCLGTFLSTLFFMLETNELNKKSKYLLIPYLLLSIFATILSLSIYLLNIN